MGVFRDWCSCRRYRCADGYAYGEGKGVTMPDGGNPFTGMNDTDYRVFRMMLRDEVAAGVAAGFEKDCTRPCKRVRSLWRMQWVIFIIFVTSFADTLFHVRF
jgi:hypothetical protein